MSDQITLPTECLITYTARVWPLSTMYELMCFQITLLTECLVAYATAVWPHSTMYAPMSVQVCLLTEGLITNFTGKTTLSTLYLNLFIWSSLIKIKKKKTLMGRRMCLKARHTLGI